MATAAISYDVSDFAGVDFDPARTKVYATNNAEDGVIHDVLGNKQYIGSGNGVASDNPKRSVGADGTGTITVPIPGAGFIPASWQTTIHFDGPDRNDPRRGRKTVSFGPYTITASGTLGSLIEEQAIPATYINQVTAQLDAKVTEAETAATSAAASAAQAKSVAEIDTSDALVTTLVNDPASTTKAALSATFAGGAAFAGADRLNVWEPPTQPAGTSLVTKTQTQLLNDFWEPLRTAAPEYVTREVIGTASNAEDIWAYRFTPPNYDNTVLLFNQHGGEKISMRAAAAFMDLVVNDHADHPALAALRARTRIVVVPTGNPGGAAAYTRKNPNGVDLNRNWDYKWAAYADGGASSQTYKGTAAFSEPESRAVRDLILSLEAEGGLNAVLDLHDTGEIIGASKFFSNQPDTVLDGAEWLAEVVHSLAAPGDTITIPPNAEPQACNWIMSRGIRSASVEFEQTHGTTPLDSANQTAALRWIGNVILHASRLPVADVMPPQAWTRCMDFTSGATTFGFTTAGAPGTEATLLRWEFIATAPGVLEFYGEVMLGSSTGRAWIRPAVGQMGTEVAPGNPLSVDHRYVDLAATTDRRVLPFSVTRRVVANPANPVRVTLFGGGEGTTPAAAYILKYQGIVKFTPSEGGARFYRTTATGRTGVGAMQEAAL